MKKTLILGLAVAAGAAAYLIGQAMKKDDEEKTIITLNSEEDSGENTEEETPEEESSEEEPQYSREVQEINLMYPYLTPSFIAESLKEQTQLEEQYPEGSLVTVVHHINFPAVENLITFVRIIKEHDYQISEADGDQSLTISKDLIVKKGVMLSDILNVANQVCCLNGCYQGYQFIAK